MELIPTIGLEVHAELKTKTKMFCSSPNAPHEAKPNTNICPICLAHPGTLPAINREAVRLVRLVGVALNGELANYTEFDRKSYFYPDLPKGYQISQYKYPLVSGGSLNGVEITRIHLEEDTARSSHQGNKSIIDFNRAGVPLMELVTEPVVTGAKEAGDFARELQVLLRALNASDANMERGEMRVEANISVAPNGERGTKVEVKNLNSFRAVERAIEYEIERQTKVLKNGEQVTQETRGWDENKNTTFPQRLKESSEDYRYFPDPDLPKLYPNEVEGLSREELKAQLPELPQERRERYISTYGIKEDAANFIIFDTRYTDFFENIVLASTKDNTTIKLAVNYLTSDVPGILSKDASASLRNLEEGFMEIITLVGANSISSRGAKDAIAHLLVNGGSGEAYAKQANLFQVSDTSELGKLADEIISENADVVEQFKGGKESSLQFLVGQMMRKSSGSADPKLSAQILTERIRNN